MPALQERNTSRLLAEFGVRWPTGRLGPLRQIRLKTVGQAAAPPMAAIPAAWPPPGRQQWHENRPRSRRQSGMSAIAPRRLTVSSARLERKTRPEQNRERPKRSPQDSCRPYRVAHRQSPMQARLFPATPQKTRWRVSQSLEDLAPPTATQKHLRISACPPFPWKTMSPSPPLCDHLYSWY